MKIKDEHQVLQASQRKKLILLVIGVILIRANLRAPLTSVGPLVSSIRDSLGMTNAAAGTITTVPLLAFACLSPFVPLLSRRFGPRDCLTVIINCPDSRNSAALHRRNRHSLFRNDPVGIVDRRMQRPAAESH